MNEYNNGGWREKLSKEKNHVLSIRDLSWLTMQDRCTRTITSLLAMRYSVSKDTAFNGETTPSHTFLCSDLQCLPPGDPIILYAKLSLRLLENHSFSQSVACKLHWILDRQLSNKKGFSNLDDSSNSYIRGGRMTAHSYNNCLRQSSVCLSSFKKANHVITLTVLS